jgi:hypothetical protein
MLIGHLCAHTLSTKYNHGGYEGVALEQIWPVSNETIISPLQNTINYPEFVSLSEAVGASLPPAPGWE